MFLREVVTRRKSAEPVRYAQIVEAYRNAEGQSRHRVLLSLGRVDRLDKESLRRLIVALARYLGDTVPPGEVAVQDVRDFGLGYTIHGLWRDLGFRVAIRRLLERKTGSSKLERALFVLVVHYLETRDVPGMAYPWLASDAWVPGTRRVAPVDLEDAVELLEQRGGELVDATAELLGQRRWTIEDGPPPQPEQVIHTIAVGLSAWIEQRTGRPFPEVFAALRRIRALERRAAGGAVWETTIPSDIARRFLADLGLSAPPRSLPRPAR